MNTIPFDGMDEIRLRLSENADAEQERRVGVGSEGAVREGGARLDSLISRMEHSQVQIANLMRRKPASEAEPPPAPA